MKTAKRNFLIIALVLFLLLPSVSSAVDIPIDLNLEYPEIGGFDLNDDQDLNQVVAWFYYFVITIAGMAVFAMLVWGGFTWLTSTGDPSKIASAKDRIYSAFLGLVLILASFLIMRTINPELVVLQLPGLPTTCADVSGDCVATSTCDSWGRSCHSGYFDCDPVAGQCCCLP